MTCSAEYAKKGECTGHLLHRRVPSNCSRVLELELLCSSTLPCVTPDFGFLIHGLIQPTCISCFLAWWQHPGNTQAYCPLLFHLGGLDTITYLPPSRALV
jgi:hypothetical protein